MPVQECYENGKNGYKWGRHGKCFLHNNDEKSRRDAKRKAIRQGVAIRMSQERRKKNKS